MERFNNYAPVFMNVGHRHQPFGNKRHPICCSLTPILWRDQIKEGKDLPQQIYQKEYNGLEKTVSLMLRVCRTIFGSRKDVVLYSGFCVSKGITDI